MALNTFHPVVSGWFEKQFDAPTPVQAESWPAIAGGQHTLLSAPTGSGKTLAAFMASIDALLREGMLTVEVTEEEIKVCFGRGPIRKTLPLEDVETVQPVKNRWYYGWGIRWFPGGWLLNVSGLDAVELRLRDGRKYRIGTDEPARLSAAIEGRLTARRA